MLSLYCCTKRSRATGGSRQSTRQGQVEGTHPELVEAGHVARARWLAAYPSGHVGTLRSSSRVADLPVNRVKWSDGRVDCLIRQKWKAPRAF